MYSTYTCDEIQNSDRGKKEKEKRRNEIPGHDERGNENVQNRTWASGQGDEYHKIQYDTCNTYSEVRRMCGSVSIGQYVDTCMWITGKAGNSKVSRYVSTTGTYLPRYPYATIGRSSR